MRHASSYQTIQAPDDYVDYEAQGKIVEALRYAIDDALSNHRAEIFEGAREHLMHGARTLARDVSAEELRELLPEALRELALTFKG
jgi:hypothetical protein